MQARLRCPVLGTEEGPLVSRHHAHVGDHVVMAVAGAAVAFGALSSAGLLCLLGGAA